MKDLERISMLAMALGEIDLDSRGAAEAVGAIATQLIEYAVNADRHASDMERVIEHIADDPDGDLRVPVFNSQTDAEWFDRALDRCAQRLKAEKQNRFSVADLADPASPIHEAVRQGYRWLERRDASSRTS